MGWSNSQFIVLPITIIVTLVISFLLNKFLKDRDDKIKELPLKLIAVVIVVLEIIKQIRCIVVGYSLYNIPLHYCSLFVFLFPFAQFGNSKIKDFIKPVAFASSLLVSISLYIGPSSIIGNACDNIFVSFPRFHTFTFHYLVTLYCALSIALNDYKPKKNDYKTVIFAISIYGIIAIMFSYLLDTNYCNFLYSTLDFIDEIRIIIGQIPYVLLVFVAITVGTLIVSLGYYYCYNLLKKD